MASFRSGLIAVWQLLYRLLFLATLFVFVVNWQRILLRVRLAPTGSLFGHFGWLLGAGGIILLFTAAVHESGHLVAGRLAGLRFYLVVIGPLRISREDGRFQFSRQRGVGLFNGLAASLPEDTDNLRRRMLLFALGGPSASLLLAIVALGSVWLGQENGRFPDTNAWLWESLLFVAIASFLFFLTSMKPGAYQNGYMADGGRIAILLQADAYADSWCALVAINAANVQGQRPREWDGVLMAEALLLSGNTLDSLTAKLMGYQWAVDNGRLEQAADYLEQALQNRYALITNLHSRIILEKVYLLAWGEGDVAAAQNWIGKIKENGRQKDALLHRVKAALFLAAGDYDGAISQAGNGILALEKATVSGIVLAEMDWLNAIIARANHKQPP